MTDSPATPNVHDQPPANLALLPGSSDDKPRRYVSKAGARNRAELRRAKLAELVHLGLTETQLSERLAVSPSTIHYDLQRLRAQWYSSTFEKVNDSIAADCDLLSFAVRCLMPSIAAGNAKSVDSAVRALELKNKLSGALVGGSAGIDISSFVIKVATGAGYDPSEALEMAAQISQTLKSASA